MPIYQKFFGKSFFISQEVRNFVSVNNTKHLKIDKMEHLTNIQITRQRAKYNEVLRKKLKEAGIQFAEVSTKYGKKILVNETDYSNASKILLSISLNNSHKS